MRTFKNQAAQGDVLIMRCEELPENATLIIDHEDAKPGDHIVAHSETGHHHVMATDDVDFYDDPDDSMNTFAVVKKQTQLRHLREEHNHEALVVDIGTYRLRRQREHSEEGVRRAVD